MFRPERMQEVREKYLEKRDLKWGVGNMLQT